MKNTSITSWVNALSVIFHHRHCEISVFRQKWGFKNPKPLGDHMNQIKDLRWFVIYGYGHIDTLHHLLLLLRLPYRRMFLKCHPSTSDRCRSNLNFLKELIKTPSDTSGASLWAGNPYSYLREGHAAPWRETSHPRMSLSATSRRLINF